MNPIYLKGITMFKHPRNIVRRTQFIVADVKKNLEETTNQKPKPLTVVFAYLLTFPLVTLSEYSQTATKGITNLSRRVSQI